MAGDPEEGEEYLFDPHGSIDMGFAIVRTEHSHESNREVRENLLMSGTDHWNKWLGFCSKTWIEISFPHGEEICIGAVALKSANDFEIRDPKKVKVYYFYDNDWVKIAKFKPNWLGKRWHSIKYEFDQCFRTTKMKFVLKNPDNDCIQLGQIRFYSDKKQDASQKPSELLFDPHGNNNLGHATVYTQHSHECG